MGIDLRFSQTETTEITKYQIATASTLPPEYRVNQSREGTIPSPATKLRSIRVSGAFAEKNTPRYRVDHRVDETFVSQRPSSGRSRWVIERQSIRKGARKI